MPNRPPVARLLAVICVGLALPVGQTLAAEERGAGKTPDRPRRPSRPSPPRPARPSRPPCRPAVAAIVSRSGLPAKSFAFEVRSVESGEVRPLLSFRADQPVQLASTAKLVTSLAALDLLGPQHRWRTAAYSTGPVSDGRLRGDLVHHRRPGRPHRQRAAPLVRAAARGRPADDLRQHRPRRRRPAARSRPEAGQGDRGGTRPRRADRRPHLQPGQARGLGAPDRGRARRGEREAAAGQRAGDQRRADGRRLRRLGELEAAGRDQVRTAAAALGARPLESGLPGRGHRLRQAAVAAAPRSPSPASHRRRRLPRRAWSPSSGPRPAAACAAP